MESEKIISSTNRSICCLEVYRLINDPESNFDYRPGKVSFFLRDIPLGYRRKKNHYYFSGACGPHFCPFCAKPFPLQLPFDAWNNAYEQELGVPNTTYFSWSDISLAENLPKKFESEQWWRERNIKLKYNVPFDSVESLKECLARAKTEKNRMDWLKIIDDEILAQKNLDGVCCTNLKEKMVLIFDCDTNPEYNCSKFPLTYEPEKRRFFLPNVPPFFKFHGFPTKYHRILLSQIFYCFWCGKALPKSLAPEWFKIVTSEFGVTDIFNQKQLAKKLPPEFLTEQWWRQRGL